MKLVEHFKESYEKSKKVPESLECELAIATAKTSQYWEESKETQNYNIFKPYLGIVLDLATKKVHCIGFKDQMYNAFWDEFEKGMTVAELDRIFPRRREGLVDLLDQIRSSKVNIPEHPNVFFDTNDRRTSHYLC